MNGMRRGRRTWWCLMLMGCATAGPTRPDAPAASAAPEPGAAAALDAAPPAPAAFELTRELAFDPSKGQLPESIALDRSGNFFFSMGKRVMKVGPDLTLSEYATLPIPEGALALGLRMGPDGCLYNASGGFAPQPPAAYVFRICEGGQVERVATLDPQGFPNDLVFDGEGRLYVTEPFLGRIYRIGPNGEIDVWLEHALLAGMPDDPVLPAHFFGANGIAMGASGAYVYVGNMDQGTILKVRIQEDGRAGEPEVVAEDATLRGADGLLLDGDGTLYVAVHGQDQLVSVDSRGQITVLAKGGMLDCPSALSFGTRQGDEKTLYVTSFAIGRALGAVPGAPAPALLRATLP